MIMVTMMMMLIMAWILYRTFGGRARDSVTHRSFGGSGGGGGGGTVRLQLLLSRLPLALLLLPWMARLATMAVASMMILTSAGRMSAY